jgi:hypothetical protein
MAHCIGNHTPWWTIAALDDARCMVCHGTAVSPPMLFGRQTIAWHSYHHSCIHCRLPILLFSQARCMPKCYRNRVGTTRYIEMVLAPPKTLLSPANSISTSPHQPTNITTHLAVVLLTLSLLLHKSFAIHRFVQCPNYFPHWQLWQIQVHISFSKKE